MRKFVMAAMAASTMLVAAPSFAADKSFGESCGAFSQETRFNPTELSMFQECWLDYYKADEAHGTVGSLFWMRVGDEFVSMQLKEAATNEGVFVAKVEQALLDQAREQIAEQEAMLMELLEAAEVDADTIQAQLDEIMRVSAALDTANANITTLNGQIDTLNTTISGLNGDVSGLETLRDNLTTQRDAARMERDRLQGIVNGEAARIETARMNGVNSVTIDGGATANASVPANDDDGMITHTVTLSNGQQQIITFNAVDYRAAAVRDEQIAGAVRTAQARLDGINSVTYTDIDGNIHMGTAAVTAATADRDAAQSQVTQLQTTVAAHLATIVVRDNTITRLRADLAAEEAEVLRLEGIELRLSQTIVDLTTDVTDLTSRLATEQSNHAATRATLTTAQADLATAQADLATTRATLLTANQRINQLVTDLAAANTARTAAEAARDQAIIDRDAAIADRNAAQATVTAIDAITHGPGFRTGTSVQRVQALADAYAAVNVNSSTSPLRTQNITSNGVTSVELVLTNAQRVPITITVDVEFTGAGGRVIGSAADVDTIVGELTAANADVTALRNAIDASIAAGGLTAVTTIAEAVTRLQEMGVILADVAAWNAASDLPTHTETRAFIDALVANGTASGYDADAYENALSSGGDLNGATIDLIATRAGTSGSFVIDPQGNLVDRVVLNGVTYGNLSSLTPDQEVLLENAGYVLTGIANAIQDAVEDALQDAYDEGYDDGYRDGYADGFADGVAHGRANP